MPIINEDGKYLICPKCGSTFVDYDYHQNRFRCRIWECGWIEKEESDSKDYSCLIEEEERHKEVIE